MKRRARNVDDYGGGGWLKARREAKRRDGGKCVFRVVGCRYATSGGTAHHIRSVGAGGGNDLGNLAYVCHWCHERLHSGNISRLDLLIAMRNLHGEHWGIDSSRTPVVP